MRIRLITTSLEFLASCVHIFTKNSTSILILLSLLTLFGLHFNGFSTNDFWIQAAVGDFIRSHGELPKTALYPFTSANQFPFLAHEWGASVVMSCLAQIVGNSGLGYALIKFFISAIMFYFLYKLCRLKKCEKNASLIVSSITSIFISFRLTLRAENIAFVLFLVFLYLLFLYIQGKSKKYLGLIFLTMLVWVNVHGSFVLGFVLIGIYLLSDLFEQVINRKFLLNSYSDGLILFVTVTTAAFLNPFGIDIFISSITMTSSPFLKQMVAEWQPTFSPGFEHTPSFYFYLFYVLVTAFFVIKSFKKISIFDRLVCIAFLILSAIALRHIAYLYLATSAILAFGINQSSEKTRIYFLSFLVSLLLLSNIYVYNYGNYNQFDVGINFDAPLDLSSIEWLRKEDYHGRVFNSYILGDQLIYNFYSNLEVVVDSRTDLYGEKYMTGFMTAMSDNKTFNNFIEKNDIRLIILYNEDFNNYFFPNKERLSYLDKNNWKLAFKSGQNIILKRSML